MLVNKDVYVSDRGIPLLAQAPSTRPILTLECYRKWYCLYLLHPDGRVEEVTGEVIEHTNGGDWIDHEYHPNLLLRIAKANNWLVDELALEMAAGRWVLSGHKSDAMGDYSLDD